MAYRNKGSILVVTLFIIFLLSTIALSLAYSTRLKMNLLRRRIERLKSYYIAKGALFLVFEELEKDKLKNEFDYLRENWFLKFVDKDKPRRLDFYGAEETKEGSYKVFISDEEGKININTVSSKVIEKLLDNFKDVNSRDLAQEIAAYRIDKKPVGKFYSIYELLMVKGVNKNVFFGEDTNDNGILDPWEDDGGKASHLDDGGKELGSGLKDLITIYTEGKVNINTAPFLVLSSMPGMSPQLAKFLVDERENEPFRNVEDLKTMLGISKEEYTQISKWAVVKSDCFRILITAEANNKVSRQILAIVDRSKEPFKIIYWRQD